MADKALLLGINNYKSVGGLRGCLNDLANMQQLLVETLHFPSENIRVFQDQQVIKTRVKQQLKWLFKDATANDRVLLHFSGHGSYTTDLDGDEDDGADELICLYDMDFGNSDSYLLDDELRAWTETLPPGVRLTVVLDCCHSGTGTRMVQLAAGKRDVNAFLVDDRATLARTMDTSATRDVRSLARSLAAAVGPLSDNQVRVRFVDPPPDIKKAIAKVRLRRDRGIVVAPLNHVLLAACRSDQTAADAMIDGAANGAFTYYLCQTLRATGIDVDRGTLSARLAQSLQDGHFDQVPQLEAADASGGLFTPSGSTARPRPDWHSTDAAQKPNEESGGQGDDEPGAQTESRRAVELLREIAGFSPRVQQTVLSRLQALVSPGPPAVAPAHDGTGRQYLVYVHGICMHLATFSDPWWQSLHPFVEVFGDGTLGDTRREVVWSDLVNQRAAEVQMAQVAERQLDQREQLRADIVETLQDRSDRHALAAEALPVPGDAPRGLFRGARSLIIPGLNCIDDFTIYMIDDTVRAEIIRRFTDVVGPLLAAGNMVHVISHSWGTVVAYEGLRQLEDDGITIPALANLFTVGAALSIGPVKMKLRPSNRDGHRPAMVRRWVNLNARGDVVGGPLQDRPYQVDFDYPNLAPFGCSGLLGIVSPVCAHESYFVQGNDAVNRDIFARFINLP